MTRIGNSLKNIKYSIVGQSIYLLINFISRMVFVKILGTEYLGLNGLFSNILSILSLADLGIGAAIVYSMYKPLAEKNEVKLKALMRLYKQAYISIGVLILVLGTCLTPFLEFFINGIPQIPYINIIYVLYVLNSGLSYFFSYKRSFLIADQKKYIESFYHYLFYLLRNILQIIILLYTKNFLSFLGIQILSTLLENIIISRKVNQLYPFIKGKNNTELDSKERNTILKNVKAMVLHKVGSVVVVGTDNLLISKFVGIVEVGLYSNYLLIINALNQIYGMIFQSLTASVGNLGVTEKKEKSIFIFNCIDLFGFWIYAFSSICLIILFNPFINIWLGKEYQLQMSIIMLIVISFYLTGRRKSVLTFKDALGLFWYDRHKSLYESGINLFISIILAKFIGMEGVLLGTIISTLLTCFWIEPYVLYKYGFRGSVKSYFRKYGFYTTIMIIVGTVTWIISNLILDYTLLGFLGKLIVCVAIPNSLFLAVFWRTKEFQYLFNIIRPIIYRLLKSLKIIKHVEVN